MITNRQAREEALHQLLVRDPGDKEWSVACESKAASWSTYLNRQIKRMKTMFKDREYKIVGD